MMTVLGRLFPAQFDNVFPGKRLALWLFYPMTALVLWRSQHHTFAPDGGAQSIATIPLDSYSDSASANIIAIFAQWGWVQLLLGLLMLLAATRYRSMVPLMWLLVALEWGGRTAIGLFKPVATLETAPGVTANVPFTLLALAMLALSLWPENKRKA